MSICHSLTCDCYVRHSIIVQNNNNNSNVFISIWYFYFGILKRVQLYEWSPLVYLIRIDKLADRQFQFVEHFCGNCLWLSEMLKLKLGNSSLFVFHFYDSICHCHWMLQQSKIIGSAETWASASLSCNQWIWTCHQLKLMVEYHIDYTIQCSNNIQPSGENMCCVLSRQVNRYYVIPKFTIN